MASVALQPTEGACKSPLQIICIGRLVLALRLPACSCICASGWAGMWFEAITYLAKGIYFCIWLAGIELCWVAALTCSRV